MLSPKAVLAVIVALFMCSNAQAAIAGRPTVEDWDFVQTLIRSWIDHSSCPDEPHVGNPTHWDNPQIFADGTTDCLRFPRERNPFNLGSRLLRMAFHDAMGVDADGKHIVDGTLNLYDDTAVHVRTHVMNGRGLNLEHNGLDSVVDVIDNLYIGNLTHYAGFTDFPQGDGLLADGVPIKDVLSKADFYVWAYISAVMHAAARETARQDSANGWNVPRIQVRYGYVTGDAENPAPEVPPHHGSNMNQEQVMSYFATEFGLTSAEVVTLMGAHTLGGGRRDTSGYAGMWTQSKPRFNKDYYSNLKQPVPITCPKTAGVDGGADNCLDLRAIDSCGSEEAGSEVGPRCKGWESVPIQSRDWHTNEVQFKFQWRHSCGNNQVECTHMMLNVDMALYRDLNGFLCTEHDVGVDPLCSDAENRSLIGKVKAFPSDLGHVDEADRPYCQDVTATPHGRVFAFCFKPHAETAGRVDALDASMSTFIADFAAVFDKLLGANEGLTLLTTTGTACSVAGSIASDAEITGETFLGGSECSTDGVSYTENNPFPCCHCASGVASVTKNKRTPRYFCRRPAWTVPVSSRSRATATAVGVSVGCVVAGLGAAGAYFYHHKKQSEAAQDGAGELTIDPIATAKLGSRAGSDLEGGSPTAEVALADGTVGPISPKGTYQT